MFVWPLQVKKPKTAFILFSSSIRPTIVEQLKEKNKEKNKAAGDSGDGEDIEGQRLNDENYTPPMGDVSRETGAQWKVLSEEEKQPFNEQAAVEKTAFEVISALSSACMLLTADK